MMHHFEATGSSPHRAMARLNAISAVAAASALTNQTRKLPKVSSPCTTVCPSDHGMLTTQPPSSWVTLVRLPSSVVERGFHRELPAAWQRRPPVDRAAVQRRTSYMTCEARVLTLESSQAPFSTRQPSRPAARRERGLRARAAVPAVARWSQACSALGMARPEAHYKTAAAQRYWHPHPLFGHAFWRDQGARRQLGPHIAERRFDGCLPRGRRWFGRDSRRSPLLDGGSDGQLRGGLGFRRSRRLGLRGRNRERRGVRHAGGVRGGRRDANGS